MNRSWKNGALCEVCGQTTLLISNVQLDRLVFRVGIPYEERVKGSLAANYCTKCRSIFCLQCAMASNLICPKCGGRTLYVKKPSGGTFGFLVGKLAFAIEKLIIGKNNPTQQSEIQPRQIDLRSEEEIHLADESARGVGLPPGTTQLLELIKEAQAWGKSNNWPSYDQYPQYEKIRVVGRQINDFGGMRAMQRAAYYVHYRVPDSGSSIQHFWDGIGEWLA